MAQTRDFTSMILSVRGKLTMPLLIATVLCIPAAIFLGWGFWLVALFLLSFVIFINGMYVIMPGHAGYKIVLGNMANKSFQAGFGWMIPFISSMTEVDITRQTHEHVNLMKNKERRDISLKYVLTWYLVADNVHVLHATIGENGYIDKALCPQLDASFNEVVASKTYEDINGKLAELSKEVTDNFEPRYDHSLFKDVVLNITEVKFDKNYEDGVSRLSEAEMETKISEEQKKRKEIDAQAEAKVKEIQAAADATYIKTVKEAEAEGMKKTGEALKENPELIKNKLAENYPKVVGGATPMINLDSLDSLVGK